MDPASLPDGSVHTLTSTLSTQQPLSLPPSNNPQPGDVIGHIQPVVAQPPETPAKRRPGRPKGSGKKSVDPNAEPKVKRPVGRPRKDGLPAGSVGPKKPPRTRKRPPGTFATPASAPPGAIPPYGPPFVDPAAWQASISVGAPNARPPSVAFPIDPALDRDNWANLARMRPDAFLYELVSALHFPNPASAMGPSVEEAYRAHLSSLTKTDSQPTIPALYSMLKTFWLPSSPAYFSLTASASTNRTPSEHRFFYWDPQPLVFNGISCPVCSQTLLNKGRIATGPIKVYDLGKSFFIIGCEYVCRSQTCLAPGAQGDGRRFASTDTSILRALPVKLRDEFPAKLIQGAGPSPDMGPGTDVWSWRPMGVSTALWDMVRVSLRSGLHKDVVMGIVHATMQGLPEDPWAAMPGQSELEKKMDGMVEDVGDAEGEGDGADAVVDDAMEDDSGKEQPPEEFQEAWPTHNEVAEASGSTLPQGPPSHPSMNPPPVGMPPEYPSPFPPPANYLSFPPFPPYGYYQANPQPPPPGPILKRTFSVMADSDGSEQSPRRVRHCVKCGSNECKGKGGYVFCVNPCQDCGKVDCRGRNSKKPDKTCTDAWTPTETSG